MAGESSSPALGGIRVIDVGRYVAGPYCAALLAGFGADVIRVERVGGGEDRRLAPLGPGADGALFLQANRGKRSLALDLGSDEGRGILRALIATADVVVANLPPRTMSTLGLDYASLVSIKPDIILTAITAFGTEGPDRDRNGFDGVGQAMAGAMYLSGVPGQPMKAVSPYVDYGTALAAALATMAALQVRATTGRGQQVDTSLLATALAFSGVLLMEEATVAPNRIGTGNRAQLYGPADTVATRDGFVLVQVIGDALFERWARLIGDPGLLTDARLLTDEGRGRHSALLSARLAEWCAARTTAEALAAMQGAGVPCAPVLAPREALAHPQVIATGAFEPTPCPGIDPAVPFVGLPLRLMHGSTPLDRPPTAGEHTGQLLRELGYDAEAIAGLHRRGIVQAATAPDVAAPVTLLAVAEGTEARAREHLARAETAAQQVAGVDATTPRLPLTSAGVVGAGTMGTGIAMCLANAGLTVALHDANREAVDRALTSIRRTYDAAVAKGRLEAGAAADRLARIRAAHDVDDLASADVVVEAAFEDMAIKRAIFARLDAICRPDAILATNTSSLDVNALARDTALPSRVIGLHFFSPAHVMRLVEVVRPTSVSPTVLATSLDLVRRMDKLGVVVGVCDGFVGNRMLFAYRQQANFLLEEGATPEQIDRVITAFGLPMGPYQMGDLAGLDISWRIRQRQAATRPPHLRYSRIADLLCERGRFGQKTGAGYYRYEPGSREPRPDPEVLALIEQISAQMGLVRRVIDDEEIVERCLFPLVNEGARILEEGLVARVSDIDAIWTNGYGFPKRRGGPMFWAQDVGLPRIAAVIGRLHREQGDLVRPSTLLQNLARTGRPWPVDGSSS